MNARRYPRSMQQAFGPYTDNRLQPMPEPRNGWAGIALACAIGVAFAAVLFFNL